MMRGVMLGCLGLACVGCVSRQQLDEVVSTAGEPMRQLAAVTEMTATKVAESGVMDKFVSNARGAFHDPRLVVRSGIVHESEIGLKGFNGDIVLNVEGTGTQLAPGTEQAILDQLRELAGCDTPQCNDLRDKLVDILGWNRVESPHNPVPQ